MPIALPINSTFIILLLIYISINVIYKLSNTTFIKFYLIPNNTKFIVKSIRSRIRNVELIGNAIGKCELPAATV